jgi:hypothetical protein
LLFGRCDGQLSLDVVVRCGAQTNLLNENGKPYGPPRYLSDFREVAVLLTREAGVTHEQLHERHAAYQRGDETSFPLMLVSDEAIRNLRRETKKKEDAA